MCERLSGVWRCEAWFGGETAAQTLFKPLCLGDSMEDSTTEGDCSSGWCSTQIFAIIHSGPTRCSARFCIKYRSYVQHSRMTIRPIITQMSTAKMADDHKGIFRANLSSWEPRHPARAPAKRARSVLIMPHLIVTARPDLTTTPILIQISLVRKRPTCADTR